MDDSDRIRSGKEGWERMLKTCTGCKRQLEALEFSSEGAGPCKACVAWVRLKREADLAGLELKVAKSVFFKWFGRSETRSCAYCGITEPAFAELKRASVRGTPVKALEVHEVETDQGFTPANLHMCCANCHRIRSNLFTHHEMRYIGRAIRQVWLAREGVTVAGSHEGPRTHQSAVSGRKAASADRSGARPSLPQPVTPAVRYNPAAARHQTQQAN